TKRSSAPALPFCLSAPGLRGCVCGGAGGGGGVRVWANAGAALIATTTVPTHIAYFIESSSSRRRSQAGCQRLAREHEAVEDGVRDGQQSCHEADDRGDQVIAFFTRQRVEKGRHGVAADEPAG